MNHFCRNAVAVAAVATATCAAAQVTLYENEGFQGRSYITRQQTDNLRSVGFNDRASSVVVGAERSEVCENSAFGGRCVVLRRGSYPSLAAMGLEDRVSSVRVLGSDARVEADRYAPAPVSPQVTFYELEGFDGRSFTTADPVRSLERSDFNERASSVIVAGEMREVCDDTKYRGRCVILRPGSYPSLAAMGLKERVSSVRAVSTNVPIDARRYAPLPVPAYNYARRADERLYQAEVTAVRAVVATPEQRCWVEQEPVAQAQPDLNVPGALIGAVLGGILGHQVGNGRGKDLATAGGAVAGGALGANVGRIAGAASPATQGVQRCTTAATPSRPEYWDVTYNFRGQDHRVQMKTPPGPTVTVNANGEPRA